MTELVLTEKLENNIALVRLNRPEALNALNIATRKAIADSFAKLQEDEEVRCIVLTGNDKAFAAGADLKELSTASSIDMFKRRTERFWQVVTNTPQPIIAAIQGYAMGGWSGTGDDVRYAGSWRECPVGPARNQGRHYARGWRNTTPDPCGRQI